MKEYVLQEWVAQDGILMDHSSHHLFLTTFITWFVFPWKVTLCLHLLMKLSTISHLRRETSGKDCGWWVIDELDQLILWYIHILVQKRMWTSKMGILYSFVCFQHLWMTAVVFETYKECAINKASVFLRTNEKSSQLPM